MITISTPRITAGATGWRILTDEQRAELCAWISAHDIDPLWTRSVELDVLDCPLIRAVVHNEPLVPTEDETDVQTHTVERAIRTPQPEWWQPRDHRP